MKSDVFLMQAIAPTVARVLDIPAPNAVEAPPILGVVADLAGVRRVAVLGIDALGLRIFQHWRGHMPYLSALAERKLATVRSIMISKTPVNFACMVTGASMGVHGVSLKTSDFACETLFDVLRKDGKRSAGIGRRDWTGSELLGRFADISANGSADDDLQAEGFLLNSVVPEHPDFVIVQYGLTDELFHVHGPYAAEAEKAVTSADAWLSRVVPRLCGEGYGVVILADHGQHSVESEEGGRRGAHGSDTDEDRLVPLVWTRGE